MPSDEIAGLKNFQQMLAIDGKSSSMRCLRHGDPEPEFY